MQLMQTGQPILISQEKKEKQMDWSCELQCKCESQSKTNVTAPAVHGNMNN